MRYSEIIEELRQAPFVRAALPFLLGIVWQMQIMPLHFTAFPITVTMFAAYLLLCIKLRSYVWRWLYGVPLMLFLFFCGITVSQSVPQQSAIPQETPIKLLAVVAEKPTMSSKSVKYTLIAKAYLDSAGNVCAVNEKTLVYIRKDSSPLLQAGDELLLNIIMRPIQQPPNATDFNYAQYLKLRGIFCSAFVNADDYIVTGSGQLPWFAAFRQTLRNNSIKIIENTGIEGDELGALLTLTLGDRSRLDADLRNSYASAGASHVLAVSGAHVVIIAMILSHILLPLMRRRRGNAIGVSILLLVLWAYALVTGLAPPVFRATLMYSVMTVGRLFSRRCNTYNNLAFAAFVLCLFDPYCLYDLGFQLSFIAVMSIVFFFPRIYRAIHIRNKLLDYVWNAAAVAFAANIGTFPLVLFAFHQFPTYFAVTGVLIALPLTLIMLLFVAVFILSFAHIQWLTALLSYCLKECVSALNHIVRTIEILPGSMLRGLNINAPQTFMLLAAITLLAFLLWTKRRQLALGVLVCLCIFFALNLC